MKKLLLAAATCCLLMACNSSSSDAVKTAPAETDAIAKDTTVYPFTASYTSDVTAPGRRDYLKTVLTIWKMFERNDIDGMKPYFADSITYEDASGMRYQGSSA